MISDLVELRAAEESELNFVRHSWLRSLRSGEDQFKQMKSSVYFEGHGKLLERALKRGYCLLATPNGSPHIIVGYIVWETGDGVTALHYVYTKQNYRNMGLASYLMNVVASDKENIIATARGTRFRDLPYNPYLLIEGI